MSDVRQRLALLSLRRGMDIVAFSRDRSPQRLLRPALLLLAMVAGDAQPQPQAASYADIAPILAEKCVMCHSGDAAPNGLRLDSFDAVLKGSAKGPVVIKGEPGASELVRRIKGTTQPRMPMTGPPFLPDSQIALFERWVAGGLLRGSGAQADTQARATPPPRPAVGEPVTYAHVAPIFAARCAKCHTDKGLMGPAPEGYRLTSYEATLTTVDRVRVVPGRPHASELMRRIRGQARPRMPLDGPPYLSDDEIRLIDTWIAQGARNSSGLAAPDPVGATLRLHGTLVSRWRLDELPLSVVPRTRIDKEPAPGDYVEVRGRLGATSVEVERLRRR